MKGLKTAQIHYNNFFNEISSDITRFFKNQEHKIIESFNEDFAIIERHEPIFLQKILKDFSKIIVDNAEIAKTNIWPICRAISYFLSEVIKANHSMITANKKLLEEIILLTNKYLIDNKQLILSQNYLTMEKQMDTCSKLLGQENKEIIEFE